MSCLCMYCRSLRKGNLLNYAARGGSAELVRLLIEKEVPLQLKPEDHHKVSETDTYLPRSLAQSACSDLYWLLNVMS